MHLEGFHTKDDGTIVVLIRHVWMWPLCWLLREYTCTYINPHGSAFWHRASDSMPCGILVSLTLDELVRMKKAREVRL